MGIRGYEQSLCRCGLARGEHGFSDFDAQGMCKRRQEDPKPGPSQLTPAQCETSLKALRLHRQEMVRATRADESNLVPFLKASLVVSSLDNAIRLLERELKAVAS